MPRCNPLPVGQGGHRASNARQRACPYCGHVRVGRVCAGHGRPDRRWRNVRQRCVHNGDCVQPFMYERCELFGGAGQQTFDGFAEPIYFCPCRGGGLLGLGSWQTGSCLRRCSCAGHQPPSCSLWSQTSTEGCFSAQGVSRAHHNNTNTNKQQTLHTPSW